MVSTKTTPSVFLQGFGTSKQSSDFANHALDPRLFDRLLRLLQRSFRVEDIVTRHFDLVAEAQQRPERYERSIYSFRVCTPQSAFPFMSKR